MTKGVKYPILGFAPGSYMGFCVLCGDEFMGDKYARQCEPCAINLMNEKYSIALKKIKDLEKVISNLKEVKEFLNKTDL